MFCVLLLIPALTISVIVNINRPDCFTCGSNIGLTFWLASILALQPVILTQNLSITKRIKVWIIALLAGVGAYLVLETVATLALWSGFISAALVVGFLANIVGVGCSLLVSILGARNASNKEAA